MIVARRKLEEKLERGRMRGAGRDTTRSGRRGGAAAAILLALLLLVLAAPVAGGDAMPGPQPPGPDVGGLAFDAGGRLYAAEPRADRVAILGAANETLGVLGAGVLETPTGVAIAPGGDLLVTDEHGVRRLAPDGTTTAAWPAEDPTGIAAAADGTVYVSESDDVARFSGAGVRLGGFAADHPRGIAVAADGTVWVAVAGTLAHVSAAGVPLGATPADRGEGVAVVPDGTVLVAERERDRVARVAPDGTPAGTVAGDFDEPRGVAVDCRGNIAVPADPPAQVPRIAAGGAPPPPCFAPAAAAQAAASPEPERPIARRLTATPAPGLLPSLGRTALAATATGRVFVHLPGATEAVALAPGTLLPIGARIDARAGRVGLEFATRTADFDRFGTV